MDSQKLRNILISWKTGNENQIKGLTDQNEVLDELMKLHETGYQIDQKRIDDDAEQVRADVAEQISILESKVTKHETTIAEKEESINAKDSELAQKVIEIETLTTEKAKLETKIVEMNKPVEEKPTEVLPV